MDHRVKPGGDEVKGCGRAAMSQTVAILGVLCFAARRGFATFMET